MSNVFADYIEKWKTKLLLAELWVKLENSLRQEIAPNYNKRLRNCINCREWLCYACKFDFCITEFEVHCDSQLWRVFQNLVTRCDWFVSFSKMCLIGDNSVAQYF